ncbi:AAA family ATPase, partial [Candidatus Saccharibacteria bacterium]|nr:AAA family ATPase [Candidatus Saccharibacteria bacterium]
MKSTAVFVCSKCDGQFTKWSGQCTECGAWGTVHEDGAAVANPSSGARGKAKPAGKVGSFAALDETLAVPVPTELRWWDEILSGGIVNGSVTLLGGEPGIGKSTLTAQLAIQIARQNRSVLYVTGEESPSQVGARLKRLAGAVLPNTLSFLDETDALTVAATIRAQKPALTIVDSIQTMRMSEVTGEPGNPTQVKASAAVINEAAKDVGASVILVGQVNKDGDLAGPRLLEHLVDTVLM